MNKLFELLEITDIAPPEDIFKEKHTNPHENRFMGTAIIKENGHNQA